MFCTESILEISWKSVHAYVWNFATKQTGNHIDDALNDLPVYRLLHRPHFPWDGIFAHLVK